MALAAPAKPASTANAGGVIFSKPITATEIKVNVSEPDRAQAAAATMADGVGLLRIEHMILGLGKTPNWYIKNGKTEEYIDELVKGIKTVADAFYPRPVWVRTLDAPTDEFRAMEGGEGEPEEHNPMLGWRGIRRDLTETEHFRLEIRAFKKLHDIGLTNVGIMLPMVQHVREFQKAKAIMFEENLDMEKIDIGIMVETPGAALTIEDFIEDGIDFISLGTNDLTQYTLAVDRNNESVAGLYSELHPAILKLIEYVVEHCNEAGVKTSICGQAGSYPEMAKRLVEIGITSISANIDAVATVRETVARSEKILMLKALRNRNKANGNGIKMRDKALPEDEVMRILAETRACDYNYDRFLSTMCTLPRPIAVRAHDMFLETNLGDPGLFPGVAKLEERVVQMLGEMLGCPKRLRLCFHWRHGVQHPGHPCGQERSEHKRR